jgi:hypothetical protein
VKQKATVGQGVGVSFICPYSTSVSHVLRYRAWGASVFIEKCFQLFAACLWFSSHTVVKNWPTRLRYEVTSTCTIP